MKSYRHVRKWTTLLVPCALAIAVGIGLYSNAKVDAREDRVADLRGLNESFVSISENASKAVVFIQAEAHMPANVRQIRPGAPPNEMFRRFFGPEAGPRVAPRQALPDAPNELRPIGQGTGFIVSEDGYIVTNHHVVGEADQVRVTMTDGNEFLAEVIGSDDKTEVALLKIDGEGLPTVAFGDSDSLQVGEWALAIGNPFGLSHTVTAGIISATGRGEVGITDYSDFIQTDAAINPGNSGGPLLNIDGEVIGLNTAIYSRSGGYMGIGFAVPVNMVSHIVDQLRTDGKITRGFLGVSIQNMNPELSEWFEMENGHGIIVAEVSEDSPASKGGLLRDDIIVELDGHVVDEIGSFRSRIATTRPGDAVKLGIIRGGERITKDVEVGSMDAEFAQAMLDSTNRFGMDLEDLTPELANRLGYRLDEGVVISGIENDSIAQRAGLRPGTVILEVNRVRVSSVDEFRTVMHDANPSEPLLLLVQVRDRMQYLILRP